MCVVSSDLLLLDTPFQFEPDMTGGWNFQCQHGPDECQGNLYQACLLDSINNDNKLQIEAVNCIMSDTAPNLATEKVGIKLEIVFPYYFYFVNSAWKVLELAVLHIKT